VKINHFSCSIIIRAYNEQARIGRLLTGVFQQGIKDAEVILVDSGSTDRTVEIAKAYPVRVLQIQPEEFSFGRSLNLGIEAANAELVVIASAHVYPVYPDWLERLLSPFSDPNVALSYGMQRGDENTKFSESQVLAQWFPESSNLHQLHPFCNNANAAIRRELWKAHPYDETLTGLEDIAWANWAIDQGFYIAYVSEAEIIHVHDESPEEVFSRYEREAMAFKRIFPHERFTFLQLVRMVFSNIVSDIWHASRQRVLARNLSSIFWFRWMQYWGTYRGYQLSQEITWQLRQRFYYPRGRQLHSENIPRDIEPIQYH